MSSFVGAAQPQFRVERDDQRAGDEYFFDNEDEFHPTPLYSFDWNAVAEAMGWQTPWWPYRGGIMGGAGFHGDNLLDKGARHSDIWRSFGANGRLGFVGITRDAYGSPLGGCTVRCFRTSTSELVSQVTSDANGNYIATTPYFEAHFLTVHAASSPPVAGASIDTVTPS